MTKRNIQKKRKQKEPELYIYREKGKASKPDTIIYSEDLIDRAVEKAIKEVGSTGKLTTSYEPLDFPEKCFRRIYELLLPPADIVNREREIKHLTRAAVKYFTENESRFLTSFLYDLILHTVAQASSISLEDRGEDKETIREFRPRKDTIDHITQVNQEIKKKATKLYGSGGDRRPKALQGLWNDKNRKRFVGKVDELHDLWKHIKECYDPNLHSTPKEWLDSFAQHDCHECQAHRKFYKTLPPALLSKVADVNLSDRAREPLSLACIHAARELGLTQEYIKLGKEEPDAETLKQYYYKAPSP